MYGRTQENIKLTRNCTISRRCLKTNEKRQNIHFIDINQIIQTKLMIRNLKLIQCICTKINYFINLKFNRASNNFGNHLEYSNQCVEEIDAL